MKNARVSVVFYTGWTFGSKISLYCMAYKLICCSIGALKNWRVTHCSVSLEFGDGKQLVYHISRQRQSQWAQARAVNKKWTPLCNVVLGQKKISKGWMDGIKPIPFRMYRFIPYYFITRFICKWKPKDNCAYKSCELLNELGYAVTKTCLPTQLLEELEEKYGS